MDEQMVPIVLGEAQKAVDIFEQTVDTLKKVDTIDALDKRFAAELGPQDPLGQVERVVNITTQMAELAKETETFPAIDKRNAEKIQPKPGKREVFEDIYKKMPTTANKFDENVGKVVDKSGEIIVTCLDAAFEKIKKELKTDHGSKVRAGRFYGCSIIYAGTKSCIVVDKEKHELVYLTPENVLLSRCVEKKFFPLRGKNYYYYELVFKDGSESYVRVSKKHRQNLECCGLQDTAASIFKELLPGETCEDSEE